MSTREKLFDEAENELKPGQITTTRRGLLMTIIEKDGKLYGVYPSPGHERDRDLDNHFEITPSRSHFLKIIPNYQCHAARDGDCIWAQCPQLIEGEPKRSGRHCPLDKEAEEES